MSLRVVPTEQNVDSYQQRTAFDGKDYVLFFRLNKRLGRWFVDLTDQDETPIAVGLRLVTNWPIGRLVVDARKPKGTMIVVDQQGGTPIDAGRCNLGTRFSLQYVEAAA